MKRRLGKAVDMSMLTEADYVKVRRAAETKVQEERKKAAETEALADALELERAKYDEELTMVDLTIDLPAFTTNMLIDGVYYSHGDVARVTRAMADSLREQMSRCWEHEHVSGNPNARNYVPVKSDSFSAFGASRGFARV